MSCQFCSLAFVSLLLTTAAILVSTPVGQATAQGVLSATSGALSATTDVVIASSQWMEKVALPYSIDRVHQIAQAFWSEFVRVMTMGDDEWLAQRNYSQELWSFAMDQTSNLTSQVMHFFRELHRDCGEVLAVAQNWSGGRYSMARAVHALIQRSIENDALVVDCDPATMCCAKVVVWPRNRTLYELPTFGINE
jgi:hypothetical protein